jgi:hypothetical protein
MKTKTIITAIIAAASINTLAAQELLTDGKVWNCVQRMYNDQTGEYDRPFTITVVGDTIVGGTKCKRLEQVWHDDTGTLFHFAALERDSRVYHVTDDCENEFLNFNLSVGDIDGLSGRVVAVDKVTVNGITRKRITIDRDGHLQYLVDGIGLSDDYLRSYELCSYYTILQSVTEQGSQIFATRDFTQGTTAIHSAKAPINDLPAQSFDLSGRRASKSIRGIVIAGCNKKVLK